MPKYHNWSEADDIVALYLSRAQGTRLLNMSEAEIARRLSARRHENGTMSPAMPESSLHMRRQNFDFLAGKPNGLRNYARQSKRVHEKYKATPLPELRVLVLGIIG